MIKNIGVLAEKLKGIKVGGEDFTPESFKKAFESDDEIEIGVPEGDFLTDEQITELKSNVVDGSMRDGIISGAEQLSKAIKRTAGLDFDGKMITLDSTSGVNFNATASDIGRELTLKLTSDLKIPQDKKVQELTTSLDHLRGTYETEKADWEQKDTDRKSVV